MTAHRAFWGAVLVALGVAGLSIGCGDRGNPGGTLQNPWNCGTDCGGTTSQGGQGQGAGEPIGSEKLKWAAVYGDETYEQRASRIVADDQGNVIMTGLFAGSMIMGPKALVAAGVSEDIFIAKFQADGTFVWGHTLGDVRNISVDPNRTKVPVAVHDGNIFVAARFFQNAGFAGGELVAGQGVIVAKLDENGGELWNLMLSESSSVRPGGIGVDAEGNVYVSGSHEGTMTVGPDEYKGPGVFVAKLDKDGGFQWLHDATCSCDSIGAQLGSLGLAVSAAGDTVVVGTHTDNLQVDDTVLSAGTQDSDGFAYMLDTNAVLQWAKGMDGSSSDECWAAAFDPTDGGVVVGGMHLGSLDLGDGVPMLESTGAFAGFVAKLDQADGTTKWATAIAGAGHSPVRDVAVNASGNIAATGDFNGSINVGTILWRLTRLFVDARKDELDVASAPGQLFAAIPLSGVAGTDQADAELVGGVRKPPSPRAAARARARVAASDAARTRARAPAAGGVASGCGATSSARSGAGGLSAVAQRARAGNAQAGNAHSASKEAYYAEPSPSSYRAPHLQDRSRAGSCQTDGPDACVEDSEQAILQIAQSPPIGAHSLGPYFNRPAHCCAHAPSTHTSSLSQALSQLPQPALSLLRSAQLWPHSSKPAGQASPPPCPPLPALPVMLLVAGPLPASSLEQAARIVSATQVHTVRGIGKATLVSIRITTRSTAAVAARSVVEISNVAMASARSTAWAEPPYVGRIVQIPTSIHPIAELATTPAPPTPTARVVVVVRPTPSAAISSASTRRLMRPIAAPATTFVPWERFVWAALAS